MATAGSSPIRGILFDKDGTLVDFNRTWFGITMELAHKAADGDEARARALVEAGGYDWEMEKFRGGSVVAAGTINDIVDLWHPELTLEEKRARIRAYDDYAVREGSRRAVGIEGLQVTLEALVTAGFVLGIATNDSEAGARATAEALGLTALFSVIIGYNSVRAPSPMRTSCICLPPRLVWRQMLLPWSAIMPMISRWPMRRAPALPSACSPATARSTTLARSAMPSWVPLPNCRSIWRIGRIPHRRNPSIAMMTMIWMLEAIHGAINSLSS